jgi:phosphatidylserine decarboxylase
MPKDSIETPRAERPVKVTALSTVLCPVHRAGWPFIAFGLVVAIGLFFVFQPAGWAFLAVTAWMVYFFRDPVRVTPVRDGLVIAPADGRVQMIEHAAPPKELALGDAPRLRISIFLNVFDVHCSRVPADGTLDQVVYTKGKFVNAALDKASEENERTALLLRRADGREIIFSQIAGLVARRIICDAKPGQQVKAGERFGFIRFGSRMDVYLPEGAESLVSVGQRTLGGETVLADLDSTEGARAGAVR